MNIDSEAGYEVGVVENRQQEIDGGTTGDELASDVRCVHVKNVNFRVLIIAATGHW